MSQNARGDRARDMSGIMALDLPLAEPTPQMRAYFDKCRE